MYQYEWNIEKALRNIQKHHVSFEEAQTVFDDPLARIFDDPMHSKDEERFIIIGHSIQSRLLLVAFTERKDRIRIISARKATKHERRTYETAEF